MKHAELVVMAGAWLKRMGCSMVFVEMSTVQSETPDAIGWRSSGAESYLIECKASRSDFFADRHKGFRDPLRRGMGRYRYYMCPAGMLKVEDMPAGWGLLHCHRARVDLVHGKRPGNYKPAPEFEHQPHLIGEMRMMHSALSRLRIDLGVEAFHTRVHLPFEVRKRERRVKQAAQP